MVDNVLDLPQKSIAPEDLILIKGLILILSPDFEQRTLLTFFRKIKMKLLLSLNFNRVAVALKSVFDHRTEKMAQNKYLD